MRWQILRSSAFQRSVRGNCSVIAFTCCMNRPEF